MEKPFNLYTNMEHSIWMSADLHSPTDENVEGKNRFNFISTELMFLKLCIPLSITHRNSGKEIKLNFAIKSYCINYYHFSPLFYAILTQEVTIKVQQPLLHVFLLY